MNDPIRSELEGRLHSFKQDERPEVVLLIADDPSRTKIVIAWSHTTVSSKAKPTRLRHEAENGIWDWLWENTEYSEQELAAKSTLPVVKLREQMQALIGNGVLYPDGTVNSFVLRYLRQQVLKLFEGKPKRAAKPTRKP